MGIYCIKSGGRVALLVDSIGRVIRYVLLLSWTSFEISIIGWTAGECRGGGEPWGATWMRLDLNSAGNTVGVGNINLFLLGMGQFNKGVEHRVPSRSCQYINIGRCQIR